LKTTVQAIDQDVPCVLIENAPGSDETEPAGTPGDLRASLGLAPGQPVVLYTGTFEPYQGLDLLLDSFTRVVKTRPDARLVLAGGHAPQIDAMRNEAASRGIADAVIFAGQRPSSEIPLYLRMADVLVSPRSTGTNTPLK